MTTHGLRHQKADFLSNSRSSIVLLSLIGLVGPPALWAPPGRPAARPVPRIERFEPGGRFGTEGPARTPMETPLERDYRSKEIAPGVFVREEQSDRRFGGHYSADVKGYSEAQFRQLAESPIDIRRLRLISLIDNTRTSDAIKYSQILSRIAVEGDSYTRQQLLASVQTPDSVVLLFTHVGQDGQIQTKDGALPVQEVVAFAKKRSVPILVVGCNSDDFIGTGYTGLLNSLEMVGRLEATLKSAHSYRDFVNGLAPPGEAVQLDWAFLIGAGEILRIKILDSEGKTRAVVYASGFPGMQVVAPPPSGLSYLAVHSGLPYWLWRGVGFTLAMILGVYLVGFVRPGLGDEVFELCSASMGGCATLIAYLAIVLAFALVASLLSWLGVILFLVGMGFLQSITENWEIPAFVVDHPRVFGVTSLTVLGLFLSGVMG